MKDKFTIELVWHNCKTCPPEEDWNNQLIVTDGDYTTVAQYEKPDMWYDFADEYFIPKCDLSDYWWADVRQTMAESVELMYARQENINKFIDEFNNIPN